jgi:hypothetical protein
MGLNHGTHLRIAGINNKNNMDNNIFSLNEDLIEYKEIDDPNYDDNGYDQIAQELKEV